MPFSNPVRTGSQPGPNLTTRNPHTPCHGAVPTIKEIAAHAATILPIWTEETYRRCTRRRVTSFDSCVQLTPAGTGSTTLGMAFSKGRFHDRFTTKYYDTPREKTGFPGQSHGWEPRHYTAMAKAKHLPEPECYIMTLRDPVSRLSSGMREMIKFHALHLPAENNSFDGLIHRLRVHNSYHHSLYRYSVVDPHYGCPRAHGACGSIHNGSHFFVSQTNYLRGIDCDRAEINFICTERFAQDWGDLAERFGIGRNDSALPVHRPRSRFTYITSPHGEVGEASASFVRDVLWPWDTALHRLACKGSSV